MAAKSASYTSTARLSSCSKLVVRLSSNLAETCVVQRPMSVHSCSRMALSCSCVSDQCSASLWSCIAVCCVLKSSPSNLTSSLQVSGMQARSVGLADPTRSHHWSIWQLRCEVRLLGWPKMFDACCPRWSGRFVRLSWLIYRCTCETAGCGDLNTIAVGQPPWMLHVQSNFVRQSLVRPSDCSLGEL